MKREAAVSHGVFVPALKTLAGIAEQQGSRRHQFVRRSRAVWRVGAVLKAACRHDSDGHSRVLFFKRAVSRAGSADHIGNSPAAALRDDARLCMAGSAVADMQRQSAIQFVRNFCQELLSSDVVQQP